MWVRRFEDPLATKQRWYCKLCGTKYRCKFGVIVKNGLAMYCKAGFPRDHMKDTKAVVIER